MFTIYNNFLRYRHSALCELCVSLAKKAGVTGEVEIYFHNEQHDGLLGTCTGLRRIPEIHIYADKDEKYPRWLVPEHHSHIVRVKTEWEFISFILAHELRHITDGHRDNFIYRKNKINVRAMEIHCDSFAAKAVNIRTFKYGKHYLTLILILNGGLIGYLFTLIFL